MHELSLAENVLAIVEQASHAPHPDLTARERGLCRLLLTLCFRLGLRPV